MKVLIRMLHGAEGVEGRLRTAGWKLHSESKDWLSAYHVSVVSEHDARLRLQDLGLLTSGALRIEFPMGSVMSRLERAKAAEKADPRRN